MERAAALPGWKGRGSLVQFQQTVATSQLSTLSGNGQAGGPAAPPCAGRGGAPHSCAAGGWSAPSPTSGWRPRCRCTGTVGQHVVGPGADQHHLVVRHQGLGLRRVRVGPVVVVHLAVAVNAPGWGRSGGPGSLHAVGQVARGPARPCSCAGCPAFSGWWRRCNRCLLGRLAQDGHVHVGKAAVAAPCPPSRPGCRWMSALLPPHLLSPVRASPCW